MEKNLYDILEVSKDCTINEIKKAYAKMIRKYPPEKFNKEFSEINSAYEVLGNDEERYVYDQLNGYSKDSQMILNVGLELVQRGSIKEGRNKLQSFLKLEGEVPYVLNELAKTYELEENYKEAYEIQKKVIERGKYINFEQMNNMISYLYKLEDEENLNYYMKKAIIKFKNAETYFNLINLCIEDKKYIKAKEIIEKNLIPFLNRKNDFEGICRLAEILFEIDENKEGTEYLIRALNLDIEYSNEITNRLDMLKGVIIRKLNFKNAINFVEVLKNQSIYLDKIKESLSNEIYRDNLGWVTVTTILVQDLATLDRNNLNLTLKKFLLASIKKRISINEDMRDFMGEKVIENLEILRTNREDQRIKNNLVLLEKFHNEIYKLDAKYLFDKYGGFIPYDTEVKSVKKKKKKKNSNPIVFLLLAIVIIVALMEFL